MGFTVEVYDPTGVTLQVALDDSFGRSFLAELQAPGSWSVSVDNEDLALADVDYDDIVTFDAGEGVEFAGIVEAMSNREVAPGEEADQQTTISGRGVLAILERGLVYPTRGVGAVPLEQVRLFNWASPDYDHSGWDAAVEQYQQSVSTDRYGYNPQGWPDKDAYWIWGLPSAVHPLGDCYFWWQFTLASSGNIRILLTADDEYDLIVDGVRLGSESRWYLWTEPTTYDIELTAGDHEIAIRGGNIPILSPFNYGAVLASVWRVADNGALAELIGSTDSSWKCLAYPTEPPGMTPGKILRLLIEDAQAEGELLSVTLGFDDDLDSDGNAWAEVSDFAVKVGRDLLAVVLEMADSIIDVEMTADLTLNAWVFGTRGSATGTTMTDLLEVSHQGRGKIVNRLLVRWALNHTLVEDSASIATHGARSGYLELGDVQSAIEAQRVGQQALSLWAEPRWSTTLTVEDAQGVRVGDTAIVPHPTSDAAATRARSMNVTEDDDGVLTFGFEFRDVVEDMEVRFDRWLRRMASGALGGASAAASPAPPGLKMDVRGGVKEVVRFSVDDALADVSSLSLEDRSVITGNLTEFVVHLTTAASSGSTSFRLLLNGAAVPGSTVTLAAGVQDGRAQLDAEQVNRDDLLQVEITAVGTGAAGLVATVGAI